MNVSFKLVLWIIASAYPVNWYLVNATETLWGYYFCMKETREHVSGTLAAGYIPINPSHKSHNAPASSISHIAPFCNRNVHMCAHFCYKIVHCGIFAQCIVGFVRLVYYERISSCAGCPPQTTDHRASRATPPPTAVSSVLTTRPWHISQKLLWHWFWKESPPGCLHLALAHRYNVCIEDLQVWEHASVLCMVAG